MRRFCLVFSALIATPVASGQGTPHFWPEGAAPPSAEGAPTELAGFRFGWSPRRAAQACRRAGHRWMRNGERARCSGVARNLGVSAEMHLRFCASSLCEVRAQVAPRDDGFGETYRRLLRVLRAGLGSEAQARVRAGPVCATALGEGPQSGPARRKVCASAGGCDVARCLLEGGRGARHWWQKGGHEMALALEAEDALSLTLTFRSAERVRELSATSD